MSPDRTLERVLGVDPGTRRTGWGIVERDGSRLRLVDCGVIVAGDRKALELRLAAIHAGLIAAIGAHSPGAAAIEDVFFAKYPNGALKLGHARGVALLAAAQGGLEVHSYPPSVVKRAVSGGGRADKEQIARVVGAILGTRELPGHDATDALALAITHLNASRMPAALRAAAGRRR